MAQILIIEDDLELNAVLKEFLESHDYEVMTAFDGEEGMKTFRNNPVSLVIADIIMPNKEGIETIIELNKSLPETKIIAMSGGGKHGSGDYLKGAANLASNVKATLKKPFPMNELLKAVQENIDNT